MRFLPTLILPTLPSLQTEVVWREAGLCLRRGFYSSADALQLFELLQSQVCWEQMRLQVYGKIWLEPRLTAWVGDPEAAYSYSGSLRQPSPWSPLLSQLCAQVSEAAGAEFNAVLVNQYRDGNDGVGWHSDNEPELGRNPTIASLSLGAPRRFRVRHKHDRSLAARGFDLDSGSLLLMSGDSQTNWQHAVPKVKRAVGARINLTFRKIYSAD